MMLLAAAAARTNESFKYRTNQSQQEVGEHAARSNAAYMRTASDVPSPPTEANNDFFFPRAKETQSAGKNLKKKLKNLLPF